MIDGPVNFALLSRAKLRDLPLHGRLVLDTDGSSGAAEGLDKANYGRSFRRLAEEESN
jgi:hypothetical protein